MSTSVGQYARQYFFVCGPKFTNIFSLNVEGVVVDELLYQFSICGSVSEIHDQSRKLSEIAPDFERFSPSQILGGMPSKNKRRAVAAQTARSRCKVLSIQ